MHNGKYTNSEKRLPEMAKTLWHLKLPFVLIPVNALHQTIIYITVNVKLFPRQQANHCAVCCPSWTEGIHLALRFIFLRSFGQFLRSCTWAYITRWVVRAWCYLNAHHYRSSYTVEEGPFNQLSPKAIYGILGNSRCVLSQDVQKIASWNLHVFSTFFVYF